MTPLARRPALAAAYVSSGLSTEEVAELLGVVPNTVYRYLSKARRAGVPVPRRYPGAGPKTPVASRRVHLPARLKRLVEPFAIAKDISPEELAHRLLEATIADDLVDAVLGEAERDHARH